MALPSCHTNPHWLAVICSRMVSAECGTKLLPSDCASCSVPPPPHRPPPRRSQLYGRMVALARSCLQYGRFGDARTLLSAAGAQGELLSLCVFQGDFLGLQDYARQVRGAATGQGRLLCLRCKA